MYSFLATLPTTLKRVTAPFNDMFSPTGTHVAISFDYAAAYMIDNAPQRLRSGHHFDCYNDEKIKETVNFIRDLIDRLKAEHLDVKISCKFKINGKLNNTDIIYETTEMSDFQQKLMAHGVILSAVASMAL